MAESRRYGMRLVRRFILLGVLPVMVVLAAIVSYEIWNEYREIVDRRQSDLEDATALASSEIERNNVKSVVMARTMAVAQTSGMFGRREETLRFARNVLLADRELQAAYVVYEPNADGHDAQALSDGSITDDAINEAGRFVPYWRRDASGVRVEPAVGMEEKGNLWYGEQRRRVNDRASINPIITKPYDYEGVPLIEYTYPIVVDGEFKGVAGVDRSLEYIEEELDQIRERFGADCMIETRGYVVASTTSQQRQDLRDSDALQTKPISETPYGDLFEFMNQVRGSTSPEKMEGFIDASGGVILLERVDPVLQEKSFYTVTEVPTGDWRLVMRKTREDLLAGAFGKVGQAVLIAVIGLVVVCALLVVMAIAISVRIRTAANAAASIASGNLSVEIPPCTANDETGDLLRGIAIMRDKLHVLVDKVRQASIHLNSTARELTATSVHQEEAVGSFGASTSEIAAAIKEIRSSQSELSGTMEQVGDAASETAELALEGRSGLGEMESVMKGLEQATLSIADRLAVINDRANDITTIVTTINKVADQTNLLSVNAAIEAEKAGEYGVGFLVVAREIRRLADQSGAATLDIERMVEHMQGSVSTGVMEMDEFTDHVRRGVDEVVKIGNQIAEIIERINEASTRFNQVSEGMLAQSQGVGQINDAMVTLTGGATQTTDTAREFARASSELHDAIEHLKSAVAEFRLRT